MKWSWTCTYNKKNMDEISYSGRVRSKLISSMFFLLVCVFWWTIVCLFRLRPTSDLWLLVTHLVSSDSSSCLIEASTFIKFYDFIYRVHAFVFMNILSCKYIDFMWRKKSRHFFGEGQYFSFIHMHAHVLCN
jgi:hypothetical protein